MVRIADDYMTEWVPTCQLRLFRGTDVIGNDHVTSTKIQQKWERWFSITPNSDGTRVAVQGEWRDLPTVTEDEASKQSTPPTT